MRAATGRSASLVATCTRLPTPSGSDRSPLTSHAPLAALLGKMRREETYHLLHAEAWLRRLAEGAADGRSRLGSALECLWADAQQLFAPLAGEDALLRAGVLPQPIGALHAAGRAGFGPPWRP
jgi:hypothetical protein